MKQLSFAILLLSLLSGCAKVTQEQIPCSGSKPVIAPISDIAIPEGTYGVIYASVDPAAIVKWTGPNNYHYTGNPLEFDFYNATNYGLYTATATIGGCVSDVVQFQVASVLAPAAGTPPCAPLSFSQAFHYNNNSWLQFPYSFSAQSYYQQYDISGDNGSFISVDILLPVSAAPAAGSYFPLDSVSTQNGGATVSIIDQYNNRSYHSVSGRIYITGSGSTRSIVLCAANFTGSNGAFTVTGSVGYY